MEKLFVKFNKSIRPELGKSLSLKNINSVPVIEKIVISTGIGDYKEDEAAIKQIIDDLTKITGRKPKVNMSRKAVSAFKLRIGQPVGLTVTLRGETMYDFIDRLVNAALPRVRDFQGLSLKAFDGKGNYTIGVKEDVIFPEIKTEVTTRVFGFQINIKTTASDDNKSMELLKSLGFPFGKK